ncbi:MAG: hypothetical protein NVSMB25_05310 [Thermoleophilaceae bacterium]
MVIVSQENAPKRMRNSVIGAITLSCCVLALALAPGAARASEVFCSGTANPGSGTPLKYAYGFTCTGEIKAFSIVSTHPVDSFSSTADVFLPDGNPGPKQSFDCEGGLPSSGFGCGGDAMPGNSIKGGFTIDKPACDKPKNPLRVWIVAFDTKSKATDPFFLAQPKCKAKHKKHKKKH